MSKITFGKSNLKTRGFLPIAASFMLMPSFFFAQTEKQVQAIKKETNLQTLKVLQADIKKSTLTTKQLQAKAKETGVPFSGETDGQLFQLKGFDKKTGRPMYYVTNNVGAAAGTLTDKLNSSAGIFNLDGENMRVHEWDGGAVRVKHQEFGGRVTQKDASPDNSAHATHVAGTMVASGVNTGAKGMAPKAHLDAYDWSNDATEMVDAAMNGALLSNHSYGFVGGFALGAWSGSYGWHWMGGDEDLEYKFYGKYTTDDREWDIIAQNAPYYLPVTAAGNPRGDGPPAGVSHYVQVYDKDSGKLVWRTSTKNRQKNGGVYGFDTITNGSLGKNILTVGAAFKIEGGYKQPSDVKMASFSAFGPVDDGRIKPDISGVGVEIVSSTTGGNAVYASLSGTSMASPNVTGSLLLLQEHYKNLNNGSFMKAATVKALAIATANEAGNDPGPDYKSGWGLLNAYKAATAISTNGKYSLITEKTLRNTATDKVSVTASGTEPLVVTIAWTDPAPKNLPSETTLNERLATLVNDLDIRVKKNGEVYLPWKLDPANPNNAATKEDNTVDNVEQVVIEKPEAGATYEIEITHKATLRKNKFIYDANKNLQVDLEPTTTQDYSLVVTGMNNGVSKDLAVTAVEVKEKPANFTNATPVEFTIENKGKENISGAKVKYQLFNADTNTLLSEAEVALEDIASGTSLKKSVTLDLSKSFVNYRVLATVVFDGDQVAVNNTNELSGIYGVVADITEKDSSYSFGFENDFKKEGWTVEDADKNGRTWMKYDDPKYALEGGSLAMNFPSNRRGVNDWLFTNPLKVKANTLYRVVFNIRKFQAPQETLDVFMGDAPNSAAMLTQIGERAVATDDRDYKRFVFEFTPKADQTLYLGFRNQTASTESSYAIGLDNVSVQHAEGKAVPDFTVNKTKPNTFETVSINNLTLSSSEKPATFEWTFEPASITFVDGTDKTSKNPKVIFKEETTYSITLKATNSEGERTVSKPNYVTAANTATKANFRADKKAINEKEVVTFTNTSTGYPAPETFEWTITPSEGVEFVESTTATSKDPKVKFNNYGVYTIKLKATSPYNEDSLENKDMIDVSGTYEAVRNFKSSDLKGDQVTLSWEKPRLKPYYFEGFENNGKGTTSVTAIDEDGDGRNWNVVTAQNLAYSGTSIITSSSLSAKYDPINVSNWLVSSKIRKGAEQLSFAVRNLLKERLAVYIVPAPASGEAPTLADIKAGHKLFDDLVEKSLEYKVMNFDISQYTTGEHYVAFHHKSTIKDNGFTISLDNVEVGFNNKSTKKSGKTSEFIAKADDKEVVREYDILEAKKVMALSEQAKALPTTFNSAIWGVSTLPYLTKYEIVKNETLLTEKEGIYNNTHNDIITANGTYTYDIYAIYSDGVKSDKRTVTVTIGNLSTSDVKSQGLKIYPNPSNGIFVVETGTGVSSLKAEVYDMSGKQIYTQDFKGSKADLNLTQYPKGVYVLRLMDNNGKVHSAKLMIK